MPRFSPHLCVGFLFLVLHPVRLLKPPPPVPAQLVITQLAHTELLHTHTQLVLTQLDIDAHFIQLAHTQLHTHTTCPHTT